MNRISRTDAVTNRHDSSSMKVIAIMTMAFLPATFFATMFAVPSLAWDNSPSHSSDRIVQPSFGIYVAFSLPTTALVFLIWAFTTGRISSRKIWSLIKGGLPHHPKK